MRVLELRTCAPRVRDGLGFINEIIVDDIIQ